MATRWGIISAREISSDFTSALISQDPDEHQVLAIADTSRDMAQQFADKFGIKQVYGSYEELVQNTDIDIVYVGSLHSEHYKLSMLCLNAGKNVLCEKPVAMTMAAAKEIFSLAKEKKLFVMEAFWTRFFPVYEKVRKELASGSLGDIVNTQASFCQNIVHISKFGGKMSSGRALCEVGSYTVMLADMVFRERPQSILAKGQFDDNGMDTGGAMILTFSRGRIASSVYSLSTDSLNNSFVINGTKGSMKVEPPCWCPTHLTTSAGEFEFPLPECKESMNYLNSEGLQYEQNYVRQCLQQGQVECSEMSHSSSENIQYIMETVAQQLGIKYDHPHTV